MANLRLNGQERTLGLRPKGTRFGRGAAFATGEPGVPRFAPAWCSAIFAAAGRRIRPIGGQLV